MSSTETTAVESDEQRYEQLREAIGRTNGMIATLIGQRNRLREAADTIERRLR